MAAMESWEDRSVLVTGAGGFIGSHLCERLAGEGAKVRAMVRGTTRGARGWLTVFPRELAGRLEIIHGDVGDQTFLNTCAAGMDAVYHLAAVTSVAYSYTHPEETFNVNAMGTLHVCNACRQQGVRRYVHISSAGSYGTSGAGLIEETHSVKAHNPYTASKLAADHLVESYHLSYGLPVCICRIFNTFGPRMAPFLVMPEIIMQLVKSGQVRLGALEPLRNFTYVDDIVDGFVRMGAAAGVEGELVNLGSPRSISIRDLAIMIAALMGRDIHIDEGAAERLRPCKSEINQSGADYDKIWRLVGWEPKVSLEHGLRKLIAWVEAGGYDRMGGAPDALA